MNQHLHKLLIFQKLNMGSPSNPCIEILIFNLKVDIKSEKHLGFQTSKDVFGHLTVLFSLLLVLLAAFADLDTGGVEGSVLVLPRADKDDVLEPVEAI